MAVGQFLGIYFQSVGPIQYVLRIYVIILCLLVMANELEWTIFTRDSMILKHWITRGLFYAFIGVLGLEENDTTSSRHADTHGYIISLQFIKAVAWIMIGCGTLYFGMGMLCLHYYYNRLRDDYQERVERARQARQGPMEEVA